MIAGWVADTVRAFGRQMGLSNFEPNERGAAGVSFENGMSLYLEHAEGAILMSAALPADATAETTRKLLSSVHPSARLPLRIRAIRMSRTGEARFVCRIAERDLTVSTLEEAFRTLWQVADYFRRAVA